MLQDETFIRVRQVNKAGVSVVIVEQNARRCLQICDRGYVLDQGRNAYSGKGRDLMNDPKSSPSTWATWKKRFKRKEGRTQEIAERSVYRLSLPLDVRSYAFGLGRRSPHAFRDFPL